MIGLGVVGVEGLSILEFIIKFFLHIKGGTIEINRNKDFMNEMGMKFFKDIWDVKIKSLINILINILII